jgi:hypothetical protein
MLASALALGGLLGGCGNGMPPMPAGPGSASPTPPPSSPSPPVTSAGFLHVLQHPWVMTYEIDPSGRLRPPVTQRIGRDLNVLAGEPQGRFVYAGHGGWSIAGNGPVNGSPATIVTYGRDPRDGTLAKISEQTVFELPLPPGLSYDDIGGWNWLRGGTRRLHGLWLKRWGPFARHTRYTYVSIPVDDKGVLGPASRLTFPLDSEFGDFVVDVNADVLYKAGPTYEGGLEAHVIEPDGSLTRMGRSHLCFAAQADALSPVATARGFLFATFWNRGGTVCAYQGLRLRPLYALDMEAYIAETFIPPDEAEPALVAMSLQAWTGKVWRYELRLFIMDRDGDLRQVYSEDVPDRIVRLLFHSSGRSLYTVDYVSRLRAYTVHSDGRLELTMDIEHGGGSMAMTLKDVRAADR